MLFPASLPISHHKCAYVVLQILKNTHIYTVHVCSLSHVLPPPPHTHNSSDTGLSTGVIASVVIGSVVVSVMIFIAGCGAGVIAILVYQKTSKQTTSMCSCLSTSMCSCLSTSMWSCFSSSIYSCLSTSVPTLVISPHHSLQNPLNLKKIRRPLPLQVT